MVLVRLLATLIVGFFMAWIIVAFQRIAASGSTLSLFSVVAILFGFIVVSLVGLRLVL